MSRSSSRTETSCVSASALASRQVYTERPLRNRNPGPTSMIRLLAASATAGTTGWRTLSVCGTGHLRFLRTVQVHPGQRHRHDDRCCHERADRELQLLAEPDLRQDPQADEPVAPADLLALQQRPAVVADRNLVGSHSGPQHHRSEFGIEAESLLR